MHVPLLDASVSQALLHEAHGITEVAHAKLLEACSRQRARVVDALLCQLILLQPIQSLLHCSLDLFLVATFELIPRLLLVQSVRKMKQ